MGIPRTKAIEVRDANDQVIGWDTTCAKCGVEVHFIKGSDAWKKDTVRMKPDDSAKCWECHRESVRSFKENRKARRKAKQKA